MRGRSANPARLRANEIAQAGLAPTGQTTCDQSAFRLPRQRRFSDFAGNRIKDA